jgi:hypothetical protein
MPAPTLRELPGLTGTAGSSSAAAAREGAGASCTAADSLRHRLPRRPKRCRIGGGAGRHECMQPLQQPTCHDCGPCAWHRPLGCKGSAACWLCNTSHGEAPHLDASQDAALAALAAVLAAHQVPAACGCPGGQRSARLGGSQSVPCEHTPQAMHAGKGAHASYRWKQTATSKQPDLGPAMWEVR